MSVSKRWGARLKKFERVYHSAMRFVWPLLAIPTILWWKESILWVAVMSLYANFAAEVAAYQGAESVRVTEEVNGDSDQEN